MAKKPLKTNDKSTMLRRHKRSFINRPLETSPLSDSADFNLEIDDALFNLQGLNHENDLDDLHQEQQKIMIRGIAHDVNNNLMAILSACDKIENKMSVPHDLEWAFNSIRMHVKSSGLLMRDLVNADSSDTYEVLTQEQLDGFLHSILPSLYLVAGKNTRIEIGAVVTPPVRIHRMFLHRVLMQFIRNISELDIQHPVAFISVRRVKQWCEVSVSDNGPGLQGLDPKEIFNPGVSSKGSSSVRGYGLSDVAWPVNYWNGEYGVDAIESDSGCRFWVRIPLFEK